MVASLPGLALYLAASVMMFLLHKRRPSAMLISLITAYALLAESMVAGMSQLNWHLSWWEWHILLTFAFVFVAYSAYLQFRREGSSAGLFDSVALSATVRRIQRDYDAALEELVEHVRRGEPLAATRLAGKFGLNEGQAAVLDRAGGRWPSERELSDGWPRWSRRAPRPGRPAGDRAAGDRAGAASGRRTATCGSAWSRTAGADRLT